MNFKLIESIPADELLWTFMFWDADAIAWLPAYYYPTAAEAEYVRAQHPQWNKPSPVYAIRKPWLP